MVRDNDDRMTDIVLFVSWICAGASVALTSSLKDAHCYLCWANGGMK
jgi:hypothetical protein